MSLGHGPLIVRDGLVLQLDAANVKSYSGSGTAWNDLSNNGNNGVLTNGPIYSSGNNGYITFDGNDEYAELGTISTSNPLQLSSPSGGGITVMFASYWNGLGDNYQRIIDKSNGGNALNGWSVFPDLTSTPVNTPLFGANPGPTTSDIVAMRATIAMSTFVWEIWAFTHNQSSGNWSWYKNGSLINSGTDPFVIPSVQTNAKIGTWNHSTGREWNGRIGFLSVYEKDLTATEIKQNFEAARSRYGI
jgi:hypothetical protein